MKFTIILYDINVTLQNTGGIKMSGSLYVGNLSWQTTEDDLMILFGQHTKVKDAKIITDRETGRSKGFAFVEIPEEDVEKAISALNGFELNGREIIVN